MKISRCTVVLVLIINLTLQMAAAQSILSPFGRFRDVKSLPPQQAKALLSQQLLTISPVSGDDVVTAKESVQGVLIRGQINGALAEGGELEPLGGSPTRTTRNSQPTVRLYLGDRMLASGLALQRNPSSTSGGSQFEFMLTQTHLRNLGLCEGQHVLRAELMGLIQASAQRSLRLGGQTERNITRLDLSAGQVVHGQPQFNTVGGEPSSQGGLSGMDWDPVLHKWWIVSDSKTAPRVYVVDFDSSINGSTPVVTDRTQSLAAANAYDAEGVRVYRDACGDGRLYTINEGIPPTVQPSIDGRDLSIGSVLRSFLLPANLLYTDGLSSGSRSNRIFEGLALSPDGSRLFVALEQGLATDGPVPTHAATGMTRIVEFDRQSGRALRQMAYRMDSIFVPESGGAPTDIGDSFTGISEIVALDNQTLLVLERSLGKRTGLGARVYKVDLSNAPDVTLLNLSTFSTALPKVQLAQVIQKWPAPFTPRMEVSLPGRSPISFGTDFYSGLVGNFEGMGFDALGRLVLLSDDNFNPSMGSHTLTFIAE